MLLAFSRNKNVRLYYAEKTEPFFWKLTRSNVLKYGFYILIFRLEKWQRWWFHSYDLKLICFISWLKLYVLSVEWISYYPEKHSLLSYTCMSVHLSYTWYYNFNPSDTHSSLVNRNSIHGTLFFYWKSAPDAICFYIIIERWILTDVRTPKCHQFYCYSFFFMSLQFFVYAKQKLDHYGYFWIIKIPHNVLDDGGFLSVSVKANHFVFKFALSFS